MRGSQEEHGALYYKQSEKVKQKVDHIRRSFERPVAEYFVLTKFSILCQLSPQWTIFATFF